MLTENREHTQSGKVDTSAQKSSISRKVVSLTQCLGGAFFLAIALYTLQRMAIQFQGVFINRDYVLDWLAPLTAMSFMIGWLTLHFAEVAARRSWRRVFVSLWVIWVMEVSLSFVAFFSQTELLRQGALLYGQCVVSGGMLRLSIFHQGYPFSWKKAQEA